MSITLNRFNTRQITPLDDVRLNERIFTQNGMFTGCVLTHLGSNQVQITAGAGILEGRDFKVTQETLLLQLASSGTMPGRIYIHCDLSNSVAPISILSVCATTLPALIQNANFNETNGIWEEELATYTASTTVISALTTTYKTLGRIGPTPKIITWGSGDTPEAYLCHKIGNLVHIDFRYVYSKIFTNGAIIGVVPSDCIPSVSTGNKHGGTYRVDTTTTSVERGLAIAVDASGNISIVNNSAASMYGAQGSIEYFVN